MRSLVNKEASLKILKLFKKEIRITILGIRRKERIVEEVVNSERLE